MTLLSITSISHILITSTCFLTAIFLPKFFVNKTDKIKKIFAILIIALLCINQLMDLYREGYLMEWKLGLPLHLCDFSTFSIIIYLLTKNKDFFLFAFFFGILGGSMSLLTPDTVYGFPYVGYIQNQIGHTMILLGVSYAMIIDNQRPELKDVHRMLIFASILLILMYLINYLLGPPANYWFLMEKPVGDNLTKLFRPAPFHMIDIYIIVVVLCYLMYLPYFLKDKFRISKA